MTPERSDQVQGGEREIQRQQPAVHVPGVREPIFVGGDPELADAVEWRRGGGPCPRQGPGRPDAVLPVVDAHARTRAAPRCRSPGPRSRRRWRGASRRAASAAGPPRARRRRSAAAPPRAAARSGSLGRPSPAGRPRAAGRTRRTAGSSCPARTSRPAGPGCPPPKPPAGPRTAASRRRPRRRSSARSPAPTGRAPRRHDCPRAGSRVRR